MHRRSCLVDVIAPQPAYLAFVQHIKQAVRVATQYAPAPFLPSRRPSASRAAEQTQRSSTVTPLRGCLATQQRELTRKNQSVRFNVVLLMRCGLNTRTRRHIQLAVHRTVLRYIIVDCDLFDLYRIICRMVCRLT